MTLAGTAGWWWTVASGLWAGGGAGEGHPLASTTTSTCSCLVLSSLGPRFWLASMVPKMRTLQTLNTSATSFDWSWLDFLPYSVPTEQDDYSCAVGEASELAVKFKAREALVRRTNLKKQLFQGAPILDPINLLIARVSYSLLLQMMTVQLTC